MGVFSDWTVCEKGAGPSPYSHARPPLLSEHVGEQLHDVHHIEILLVLRLVLKLATAFSKPGGSDSGRCSRSSYDSHRPITSTPESSNPPCTTHHMRMSELGLHNSIPHACLSAVFSDRTHLP